MISLLHLAFGFAVAELSAKAKAFIASASTALESSRFWAILFCCQSLVCVLLLAILVPPFEGPDEFNHMKRAEHVSSGKILATRYGGPTTSGGKVDEGTDRVDHVIGVVRFHPELKVSRPMLQQVRGIKWGDRSYLTFANTAPYGPFFYLPAAVAIIIAKLADLSIVHSLTVARIFTGVASVSIATIAISLSDSLAPLFLVLLSLPMSFCLFASVSQDGPMIATTAMATAFFIQLCRTDQQRPMLFFVGLCVALAAINLGRPAYIFFTALLFVAPNIKTSHKVAGATLVLLLVGIWALINAKYTIINTEAHRGVHPFQQLVFVMQHPSILFELATRAMSDRQGMEGLSFYDEFIGVLGWQDVVLPAWFYSFSGAVLLLAILDRLLNGHSHCSWVSRVCAFCGMATATVSVFSLEYLTWTPVGQPWVVGVQGRYFIPIALVLPLVLPSALLWRSSLISIAVRPVFAVFPLISAVVSVCSVVRRYYF